MALGHCMGWTLVKINKKNEGSCKEINSMQLLYTVQKNKTEWMKTQQNLIMKCIQVIETKSQN